MVCTMEDTMDSVTEEILRAPQQQERPGREADMKPRPQSENIAPGSNKLKNKVALITGGDSGIGKAVALLFAKEGADVAIVYLNEHADALETQNIINTKYNKECLLLPGNISSEVFCSAVIKQVIETFGRIDILVNNAGIHYECDDLSELVTENMIATFETNVYSMFWLTKYALSYMKPGSSIINSSSVTAYRGSKHLIDYAATKGAIVSFTRSLSSSLVDKGIRVNGVAPGPIWTPLIPSSFEEDRVSKHGLNAPMHRAGEPSEVAPSYLFLASEDASYITGQFLHPNGGEIING